MRKRFYKISKVICIILLVVVGFETANFTASEIADTSAYENISSKNDEEWEKVYNRIVSNETLDDADYDFIFSETGLGRPAVDKLKEQKSFYDFVIYRDYYTSEKSFECVREGVFACHEYIKNSDGEKTKNPDFADIRNGDIILTLSIHSLGWRHGHAAIVTDAENGITIQATMLGEKTSHGHIDEWKEYPLVIILRKKNSDEEFGENIANYANENLMGIDYSLLSGIVSGRDTQNLPTTTQCAHLVWFAYKKFGADIDSDRGRIITPYDILHSDELETVQVYGNIKEM